MSEPAATSLPDILAPQLAVIFCGINPGLSAEAAGHHFPSRTNRFWRAIHLAGFTPHEIAPENDRTILSYQCGLTTVVERPTARADQLSPSDFLAARAPFLQKITAHAPRITAFLGKEACSVLTGERRIAWGPQPYRLGSCAVWVLPNPSGRNRAFPLDRLVGAYRGLYHALTLKGEGGMSLA